MISSTSTQVTPAVSESWSRVTWSTSVFAGASAFSSNWISWRNEARAAPPAVGSTAVQRGGRARRAAVPTMPPRPTGLAFCGLSAIRFHLKRSRHPYDRSGAGGRPDRSCRMKPVHMLRAERRRVDVALRKRLWFARARKAEAKPPRPNVNARVHRLFADRPISTTPYHRRICCICRSCTSACAGGFRTPESGGSVATDNRIAAFGRETLPNSTNRLFPGPAMQNNMPTGQIDQHQHAPVCHFQCHK
jgi:hypothetical protein